MDDHYVTDMKYPILEYIRFEKNPKTNIIMTKKLLRTGTSGICSKVIIQKRATTPFKATVHCYHL